MARARTLQEQPLLSRALEWPLVKPSRLTDGLVQTWAMALAEVDFIPGNIVGCGAFFAQLGPHRHRLAPQRSSGPLSKAITRLVSDANLSPSQPNP